MDMLAAARDRATKALPADVKLDPLTILAIISAVVQLIELCSKKQKLERTHVIKAIREPTVMQQIVLRREATKEIGRSSFRKGGALFIDKLLEVGKAASPNEVEEFVTQVLGKPPAAAAPAST